MLTILLTACGNDSTTNINSELNSSTDTQETVKVSSSKLSKFLTESTICDVISVESIQKAFNSSADIKVEGNANRYSSGVTCSYTWERADAKEREDKFVNYMIDQMQGKVEKVSMRQRTTEHNFSVRLEEHNGQADYFVPTKLTEEQLQKQIVEAKKRADERLSAEQKKVAGDMAGKMMEKMLRQNNQNEEVSGVGDKAYWSSVAGGGLNVLSGNTKMFISLMIGDTKEEDIQNASKIGRLILD